MTYTDTRALNSVTINIFFGFYYMSIEEEEEKYFDKDRSDRNKILLMADLKNKVIIPEKIQMVTKLSEKDEFGDYIKNSKKDKNSLF